MDLPLVDPRLAAQQALEDNPAQRKLQIDALRERISDGDAVAARKLKEACQGFESIFLQKIWEQMRKTVGKEGYLHSRDEESYQAMFDQELARKMSEAGGIGLADMLEQQLAVKLGKATIATSPGILQGRQQIMPLEDLGLPLPTKPGYDLPGQPTSPEELYSELDDKAQDAEAPELLAQAEHLVEDRQGTHPDTIIPPASPSENWRAALSNLDAPVTELTRQPGFGLQAQFMLGGGLAARLTGRNAAAPESAVAEPAPAAGLGLGLEQDQSLPPLPQLDNQPPDNLSAASLLAGQENAQARTAPEQTAQAEQAARTERGTRFRGSGEAKKDTSPTAAPVRSELTMVPQVSEHSARARFAGPRPERSGAQPAPQAARQAAPEAAARQPVSEAEVIGRLNDLVQDGSIRQVSQAEVEAALRRMNGGS